MSQPRCHPTPGAPPPVVSELLILGDGRVLGHNLTPEFTALLAAICPSDPHLRRRQTIAAARRHHASSPSAVQP